jgi:ribosome-associated protein
MIVHIMQPAIRQYYRLEEIWGEKPVKLGAAKRKSTAEAEAAEPKTKSKHLTSTQEQPEVKPIRERKAPAAAKKTTATTAAKKPAAKKAPVGKTVKVAPSKTEIAAVEATKAKPPKRVSKAAAAPADAAPAKKVIRRVKKTEE